MNTQKPPVSINTIVTHKRPHVDEIVAIVLLQQYGRTMFPGIEKAKIEFWDAGNKTPDGKNWKQHHQEGRLLIGVGSSCFDEHPSTDKDRADEHCAATLVAKYLGISDKPELEQLLRYTLTNDTKGGNSPFDLAALITLGNKTWFDTDPQGILEWSMQPITWWLQKQIKFFTKTKAEFEKWANVFSCLHKGREVIVVAIQSDDIEIGAYARSGYGAQANIVIQQNSKGQVSISSQKRANICFDDVIVEIRKKEAKLKHVQYSGLNLGADGTLPEIPEWYYDKPSARLLNGALSAPNVPATKIDFEDLVSIVKRGLCVNFLVKQ